GADVVDPQPDGGDQHTHGDRERADREPSDVHGDRDGGGSGDDRGSQGGGVGASGGGGEPTTVGDREGRERESGDRRGGDVQPSGRERDGDADDSREYGVGRDRRPDLVDAEPDGGIEHADRGVGVALREPGDVHGDGDGRGSGDDRAERRGDVGSSGDGGEPTAVGDREGRQREPGGGGGSDVHPGGGKWDGDDDDDGEHRVGWGRGPDLVEAEPDRGDEHADGDIGDVVGKPGDLHSDGDGRRGDEARAHDGPVE